MLNRLIITCYNFCCIFFFNDTATTEIYTLSLHDTLPILDRAAARRACHARSLFRPSLDLMSRARVARQTRDATPEPAPDRKSTRLNSSHANISYAVFCLKKKKKICDRLLYSIFLHSTYIF